MSQFDMSQIFEQAKVLQERLAKVQAELGNKTVTGQAGGGMVTVTANGLQQIVAVRLDPLCVDNRDVKMLEDLITAATNQALREAKELAERELGSATGLAGMLGGLGL